MTTVSVSAPWGLGSRPAHANWPARPRGAALVWLAGLRALVAVALLAPVAAFMAGQGEMGQALWLALLPAVPLGSSAVGLLLRERLSARAFTTQAVLDSVVVLLVVWTTGGLVSPYTPLVLLPVLGPSALLGRRAGLQMAALLGLGIVALAAVQYAWLPAPAWLGAPLQHLLLPPPALAAYTVGVNVGGAVTLALLVGHLSESLSRTGADLMRATSSLADLTALSQRVIDSMAGGLVVTDAADAVVLFNRTAETITGLAASDVLGTPLAAVLPVPAGAQSGRGAPARIEFTYTRQEGSVVDLGATVAPLLGDDGRPAGQLVTFQDLTLINQREAERQRQVRLAAVGEMAAGIAHEIRNPLASMTGSIQLLRRELTLRDDHALLIDIVMRESQRLNEIITSFLAYAGPHRVTRAPVDMARVVRETAALLQQQLWQEYAGIRVEVEAPPRLLHDVDDAQIRQVIWNLASNGLKAMPAGGVLHLSVACVPAAEGAPALRLAVRDDGVGIEPGDVDRMFLPFQSGFRHGSGLGLAIVRRIVTDHRGQITVQSTVGVGTEIVVAIPPPAPPAPGTTAMAAVS